MSDETIRLYFEDQYRVEFEAKVLDRVIYEGKPVLILDQTCFYPESGGQPFDKGTINGIQVINVIEEKGKILHVLEENVESENIRGEIDWDRRFDHMQQHAGQHILSQSFYKLYRAKTLSFHLGQDFSTLEMDMRNTIDGNVEKVEKLANEIVFKNGEIKSFFIPEEKIMDVPLRKPPQKKGLIRVVNISDFDYSACGGTHPSRTGEIGLIKILKWERLRNNIRFEFVCGERALHDYTIKNSVIRQIAVRLTVGACEVVPSLEKLFADLKDQKRNNKKMQGRISQLEALEIVKNAKERIIKNIFTERMLEEVRFLALNIIKKGDYVVLYGLRLKNSVHVVMASSEALGVDMRELIPVVSPLIKGKGGGQSFIVQIAGEEVKNLELALDKAEKHINTLLTS